MSMKFFDPVNQYGAVPVLQTIASLPFQGMWDTAGFCNSTNTLSLGGFPTGGFFGVTAAAARFAGNYGFVLQTASNVDTLIAKNFSSISTNFYLGVSINWTLVNGLLTSGMVFSFADGVTVQASVYVTPGGIFTLRRGAASGTVLATASTPVTLTAYHRYEVKFKAHSTTGVIELYVDGALLVSFTGNTQVSGNASFSTVTIGAPGGNSGVSIINFCDVIMYDDQGDAPNGYLGDKRFYTNFPSGDGTTQNYSNVTSAWPTTTAVSIGRAILDSNSNLQRVTSVSGTGTTGGSAPTWNVTLGGTTTDNAGGNQVVWTNLGALSAYKLVNEAGPDDDNGYLSDSVVNDLELFTYPATPSTITGIVGLGAIIRSRKDDAGVRSQRIYVKSGASNADNGADLVQLSSYQFFGAGYFFAKDPQTAAAWNKTGVDNAEVGTKTTA
jgi:hypothetical protein